MSTKAKVMAANAHILSFARRNHIPDHTWSAACRLYVISPPRALSHTGTSAIILLYILWTLYVQIHRCSQRQIFNSVAFPVPRVTFCCSPAYESGTVLVCSLFPPPRWKMISSQCCSHTKYGKMLPWCFDLMYSLCVHITQSGNICI